ncbi:MAG: hypothetical protein WC749_11425, partial [Dehalococcoidia bacterium]
MEIDLKFWMIAPKEPGWVPCGGRGEAFGLSNASPLQPWQNPGVYLCKDDQGKDCAIFTTSMAKMPHGFNDAIKYIKFKNPVAYASGISEADCAAKGGKFFPAQNSSDKDTCGYYSVIYGAVLHEADNYQQTCGVFLTDAIFGLRNEDNTVFPGDGVSSITVFVQPNSLADVEGAGVTVYEDTNYNESDTTKKFDGPYAPKDGANTPLTNTKANASSIKIDGDYMALLFDGGSYGRTCEVFQNSNPNLDNTNIG